MSWHADEPRPLTPGDLARLAALLRRARAAEQRRHRAADQQAEPPQPEQAPGPAPGDTVSR